MKVYKHVFKLVVLSETKLDHLTLEEIAQGMDTGPYIGTLDLDVVTLITDPEQIQNELVDVGNDGEFFREYGDDADDGEDADDEEQP